MLGGRRGGRRSREEVEEQEEEDEERKSLGGTDEVRIESVERGVGQLKQQLTSIVASNN